MALSPGDERQRVCKALDRKDGGGPALESSSRKGSSNPLAA